MNVGTLPFTQMTGSGRIARAIRELQDAMQGLPPVDSGPDALVDRYKNGTLVRASGSARSAGSFGSRDARWQ